MELTLVCKGTPEEVASIIDAIQTAEAAKTAVRQKNLRETPNEQTTYVSAEVMRRALTRHPLTENTMVMLKTLCEAEEEGRYVRRSKLCEATGLAPAQLNGVLGKFGGRIMDTPGYEKGSSYLNYGEHEPTGEGTYRIPSELQGVILEILGRR